MIRLNAPLTAEAIRSLHAGDRVLLSGVIYTARDAAHARLCAALDAGEELPVDLRGQTVFYAGPTPTPPGKACGAIGPTTSMRMDAFTPRLLRYGVNAMIGKGERGEAVRAAIMETGAVYFAAITGADAARQRPGRRTSGLRRENHGAQRAHQGGAYPYRRPAGCGQRGLPRYAPCQRDSVRIGRMRP